MPLSKSYEAEGMYEEALKTAKEGIRYDEYNKELFLYAAKMALKIGKSEEGKNCFRKRLLLILASSKHSILYLLCIIRKRIMSKLLI